MGLYSFATLHLGCLIVASTSSILAAMWIASGAAHLCSSPDPDYIRPLLGAIRGIEREAVGRAIGAVLSSTIKHDVVVHCIGLICAGALELVACAMLCAGTCKGSRGLLFPHITMAALCVVLCCVGCVMDFTVYTAIEAVVWLCMVAVVGSRYSQLRSAKETTQVTEKLPEAKAESKI